VEHRDPGALEFLMRRLDRRIEGLAYAMEKMKLAEYVDLLDHPRRLLWINFISGVARGFGIAVGFSVLTALAVMLVRELNLINLPLIGRFVAEIVRFVQSDLRGTPGP